MRIIMLGLCTVLGVLSCSGVGAMVSTQDDQSSVHLTVYNMGRGLVKDTRHLTIPSGQGELRFMDVAAQIMPQTVHVKSLTSPDKLRVLEQNYEYDLINRARLLDKYVGQKIKLFNWNQYQDKKETVEATLISNNDGEVYDINGEIYLGHPGYGVLPSLPENLIAKPTLTWLFDNAEVGPQQVEVAYMTNGVSWNADYVLVVNKEDTAGDLAGWVTVDNKSGATYKDAQLKLVAGKVNVEQSRMKNVMYEMQDSLALAGNASSFKEEGLFEYHLYDLQRKTTIKDKQTKQISLLDATGVPLEKVFIVSDNNMNYYWSQNQSDRKVPVNVEIMFKNSEDRHLGMPLPEGTVRLYKEDNSGGQQFIGEDRIDHTPKDEQVKLKVGEAFDIVAQKKQMSFRNTSNRTAETSWEVSLRNHKKEDVVVQVQEAFMGMTDWQVTTSSMEFKKKDAQTLTFDVTVPKDGEVVLSYTIEVTR
ncbi:MAG: DUF4139 domain-containing protein [Candidatus Omnitrophica bacterium]|nr:DUF4139 domain-containing protein [Candidatus Omnitrophota bacterium]